MTRITPLGTKRFDSDQRVRPVFPVRRKRPKEQKKQEEQKPKYWWQVLNVDPEKVKEELRLKKEAEQRAMATSAPKPPVFYNYRRDPNEIIADAARKAEERKREEARIAAEREQKEKEEAERRAKRAAKEKERAKKREMTPEEKEALKEKRLQKLVGQVVVRCLSKHKDQLDHDTFKEKAKEVCTISLLLHRSAG